MEAGEANNGNTTATVSARRQTQVSRCVEQVLIREVSDDEGARGGALQEKRPGYRKQWSASALFNKDERQCW